LYLLLEAEWLEALEKSQISNLLPQLDSIFVDSRLHPLAEKSLFAAFLSRTLIDVTVYELEDLDDLALSNAHHLRIYTAKTAPRENEDIETILAFVRSGAHQLRAIYLDTSLHPAQSESSLLSRTIQELGDVCAKRKIEVFFEARPIDDGVDFYIPEEVWKRRRRERVESGAYAK
jgi:hypothetical protein